MKLFFHGAAQGVTGSCFRLEVAGRQLLVDCGLFQGSREIADENLDPFGFDARKVDWLLLTHAHLDHSGRIPLLALAGFADAARQMDIGRRHDDAIAVRVATSSGMRPQ